MPSELPKLVAGLMALAALGSATLSQVDPLQSLMRGGIAWFVGYVAGSLWNALFTGSSPSEFEEVLPMQIREPHKEDAGQGSAQNDESNAAA